jgi:hypothetical protein
MAHLITRTLNNPSAMKTLDARSKVIIHRLGSPAPAAPRIGSANRHRVAAVVLTLAVVLAASRALAWPFVSKEWAFGQTPTMPRLVAFQADNDHRLEITSGLAVFHRDGVGPATVQSPPFPSTDPYQPNWPGIGFTGDWAAVGDIDADGDQDVIQSCVVAY